MTVTEMNDRYDRMTVEIIERVCSAGSNCVDVGAGVGEITAHLRRVAPAGQHVAVEPLPRFADEIVARFPDVEVVRAAAADRAGTDRFVHVVSNPAYSGLRRRPYERPNEMLVEIVVRTMRLDEIIPADVRVDLIKIDVEGGEVVVLRGATGLLRRCHPVIVFEHGGDRVMQDYGTTTDELWSILVDGLGYRLHTLDGWLAGLPGMDRSAFTSTLKRNWYFVAEKGSRS